MANWFLYARDHLHPGNQAELIRRFRLPSDPYRSDNTPYVEAILNTAPWKPPEEN